MNRLQFNNFRINYGAKPGRPPQTQKQEPQEKKNNNRHRAPEPEMRVKEMRVCSGCIYSGSPLYRLRSDISKTFSGLTGNAVADEGLPIFLCGRCLHLTKKFSKFQKQCLNAAVILKRCLLWNVNAENMHCIDRSDIEMLAPCKTEQIWYDPHEPTKTDTLVITDTLHIDIPAHELPRECSLICNVPSSDQNKHHVHLYDAQNFRNIKSGGNNVRTMFRNNNDTSRNCNNLINEIQAMKKVSYALANSGIKNTLPVTKAINTVKNVIEQILPDKEINQVPESHPDTEEDIEEEPLETKDDIIIKEENLIHPVDDDDDEVIESNGQMNKNQAENTNSHYQELRSKLLDSIEMCDVASTSSASSSGTSSESSSSSDSEDEIEIHEVHPTEIDLTADDDDNIKLTDDPRDKTSKSSDTSSSINYNKLKQPTPLVTKTRTQENTTDETKGNSIQPIDKINTNENKEGKETELNIEEFNRSTAVDMNTGINMTVENYQIILQPLKCIERDPKDDSNLVQQSTQDNTGNAPSTSTLDRRVDITSSESEDDLPDCLFGLNSDIYKKDTKRAFPKYETELPKKKEKVSYVDDIYLKNRNTGETIETPVEYVTCSDEEHKDNVEDIEHVRRGCEEKKRKNTEFESIRRRFETKRYKHDFSNIKKYVNRNNNSFVVPRSKIIKGWRTNIDRVSTDCILFKIQ